MPEPMTAEPAYEIVPEPASESLIPEPRSLTPSPHWLLSLFTPAPSDTVDWSRGSYTLVTRGGRVDTSGELKKFVEMVAEGSVLYAADSPRGSAPDVAPEGSSHPVFRSGFALAIPLSGQEGQAL
jgi:CRISPR/Cas system CSM-associated protein Csm4 (group 5 of RAMP superfamily)